MGWGGGGGGGGGGGVDRILRGIKKKKSPPLSKSKDFHIFSSPPQLAFVKDILGWKDTLTSCFKVQDPSLASFGILVGAPMLNNRNKNYENLARKSP